jgi:transmembrane sensor
MSGAQGTANSRGSGRLVQAAEWLTRLRDPVALTAEELTSWEKFINSPENNAAFEAVQRVAGVLPTLARPPLPSAAAIAEDDYDGTVPLRRWKAQQASKINRRSPSRRARWKGGWSLSAGTVGFVLLCALVVSLVLHIWPARAQTFETLAAENRVVTLKDGSQITLGAKTALEVQFAHGQRQVRLHRGEALFSVAHDRSHPFIVFAGAGSVTAVGTEFNVWRTLDRTTVTVTDGAVDVKTALAPSASPLARSVEAVLRVRKGQELAYEEDGHSTAVKAADIAAATAWREGRLVYRHTPLKYVVSDVNRYFQQQLVIADAALGELQFTGAVPQNLRATEFAHALESIFQLQAVQMNGQVVLRAIAAPEPKQTGVKS